MKWQIGIVAVLSVCTTGCLKLDDFLYSPDTSIESYMLDEFAGTTEISNEVAFDLPDSLVHVFTIPSDNDGDIASIYAIYAGKISDIASDTVVLYLHGNSGHLDYYWPRIKLLANAGGKLRYGVMAIDYRG